jgi:hypothetical protein
VLWTPFRHDPNQTSLGIAPLQIAAREVGIDVALTDLLKVFIDAGGIPPWVVKLTGDVMLDQADADVFREKWRQRYSGSQAYANIGILNPGMDLQKVGDSIGDMAWPDLRNLTELKIAQVYRVPPDLIGAQKALSGGSLTTTEMDGAMAYLQRHAVQPLRMRIDGAFTRSILAAYTGNDPTYSLEFDTSEILALQEDADSRHTRVRADYDAGLITLNEARNETGRPDLGRDGEVLKLAFTTVLQPISSLNGNGATERASIREVASPMFLPKTYEVVRAISEKTERTYRDLKALSPAELETRASVLQTTQRARQKLTEIGTRQLRKFFKAQGRRIAGDIAKADPEFVESRAFSGFLQGIAIKQNINWDNEDDLLKELLTRFYSEAGTAAFAGVSAVTDVAIDWTLANPNIARIMDDLGLRIVGISEQTRLDVIERIAAGQSEGFTLQQIADSITDLFETTYKGRAETISRTETQVSYNLASQLGYQESGVVDEVEMVDSDTHCDDYGASDGMTCCERNGAVVAVDRMDVHIAGEHINGSLTFLPILSTPLGE